MTLIITTDEPAPTFKPTNYDIYIEYKVLEMYAISWFNVAKCARDRMTVNAHDVDRWTREYDSFRTALCMAARQTY